MGSVLSLAFSAIIIQNVILSKFLGICPFLGVSKSKKSALGMGIAVIFVITVSSILAWVLYKYVLVKLEMVYMKTIVFILVIASLVQIIEMFLKKFSPSLYKALGIYLPLITTNCAVLGIATLVAESNYTFLEMFTFSFASSVGFLLVIYIFSTIREKLNRMEGVMKDIPIALITAGLMAMIFARFAGVI
jgi:electron transport complex protein RnfA